jgi:hypothetical protein
VDAEPQELLGDGLAKAGLQWVVAGCRGVAGDDEDTQDRAVLDDLELADLGVAGEQGKVQGVDGDPAAVVGGKPEDVVAAAVDGAGPDQGAPARAGVGVEGVTRSVTSRRSSGWTRLCRLVTSSRAPGSPAGTGWPSGSTFSTRVVSSNRWMPWWCWHSEPQSPSVQP